MKEKFEAITPKLREAQKAYQEAVKAWPAFKMAPGKNPELVAQRFRGAVDELFTVRVLDPAMGSGHFLVEAVDFITDRMLDFLNGFPWNPVQAELKQTRETILEEMEKQGVTIDPGRLTDVALMKRHVLKRCIYGVDLNPMAVELAKVSLWLDCFTLGAPLSFLDHHLKCGNSLIGVTVKEVQKQLSQRKKLAKKTAASASEWKEVEIKASSYPVRQSLCRIAPGDGPHAPCRRAIGRYQRTSAAISDRVSKSIGRPCSFQAHSGCLYQPVVWQRRNRAGTRPPQSETVGSCLLKIAEGRNALSTPAMKRGQRSL